MLSNSADWQSPRVVSETAARSELCNFARTLAKTWSKRTARSASSGGLCLLLLHLFVCNVPHKSTGSSSYKLTADKFGLPLDAALICQDIRSSSHLVISRRLVQSEPDWCACSCSAAAAKSELRQQREVKKEQEVYGHKSVAARKFVLTKC